MQAFVGMKLKLEESLFSNDIDENRRTYVSTIEKCASSLFFQPLKKSNSDQESKVKGPRTVLMKDCP